MMTLTASRVLSTGAALGPRKSYGVASVRGTRCHNVVKAGVYTRASGRKGVLRARVVRVAAMSGAYEQPQDPYAVLGLKPDADFDAVKRAWIKAQGTLRADPAAMEAAQAAYDSIMMSQLSGRIDSMKSGGKQPKEVRYADRIEMFPWRPRYDIDTTENIVINAGLFAAFAMWSIISPLAGYQPLGFAALVAFFRMNSKLAAFSPSRGSTEEKKVQDRKRFLRVLGFTFFSLALPVILVVALPELCARAFGTGIPASIIFEKETLICAFTALTQFIMTSFYR